MLEFLWSGPSKFLHISLQLLLIISYFHFTYSGVLHKEIPLDTPMKFYLRNFHNKQRSDIVKGLIHGQPKAANMKQLMWSNEIAAKSQEWANRCEWHHRSSDYNSISNLCGTAGFSSLGENLAAGTMFHVGWTNDIDAIYYAINVSMSGWFNEHKYFSFNTGYCRYGEKCGHYTQIVWAETSHVGCALASCHSITGLPFGLSYYLVCNYGPGGNIILNGKKLEPYQKGPACSACPSYQQTCSSQGLCTDLKTKPCVDSSNFMICRQFQYRGFCKLCSPYFWQMSKECNQTCSLCRYEGMHSRDDLGGYDSPDKSQFNPSMGAFVTVNVYLLYLTAFLYILDVTLVRQLF